MDRKKSPPLQAILTPAYGRDYCYKAEVLEAFRQGKDFMLNLMNETTYCSVTDYNAGDMVKIKYNRQKCAVFYRVVDADLIRK